MNSIDNGRRVMAEHTPGPWDVVTTDYQPRGYPRAVIAYSDRPQGNHVIAPNVSSEANARLIAAAPDMLAALEHLTRGLPALLESIGYADEEGLIDEARAAIAKATGDAP